LCFCSVGGDKSTQEQIFAKLFNIGETMKDVKAPTSDSYRESLIESLKDAEEAAGFIGAILEEKDPEPALAEKCHQKGRLRLKSG
jgi:hypothetical protein